MPSTAVQQFTYWSMTWNNPDDRMMVLIRNPNQKYVRECVWTLEEGEQGTPHIQAWLRLQRNQTLSFVRKLYPGGHFKPCAKDEYNENTHTYAQKQDETTRGYHVITINDPIPTAESVYYQICERILEHEDWDNRNGQQPWGKYFEKFGANLPKGLLDQIKPLVYEIQLELVATERGFEKIFTSITFDKLLKFLPQTLFRLWTNKQTNKQEDKNISRPGSITNARQNDESEATRNEAEFAGDESQDYQDGDSASSGTYDSGGSDQCSEASDCSRF